MSYHGQAVSGGKKTGAGPLALKRELREVSQLEQTKQSGTDGGAGRVDATLEQDDRRSHRAAGSICAASSRRRRKTFWRWTTKAASWRRSFSASQTRLSQRASGVGTARRDRVRLAESRERDRAALEEGEADARRTGSGAGSRRAKSCDESAGGSGAGDGRACQRCGPIWRAWKSGSGRCRQTARGWKRRFARLANRRDNLAA